MASTVCLGIAALSLLLALIGALLTCRRANAAGILAKGSMLPLRWQIAAAVVIVLFLALSASSGMRALRYRSIREAAQTEGIAAYRVLEPTGGQAAIIIGDEAAYAQRMEARCRSGAEREQKRALMYMAFAAAFPAMLLFCRGYITPKGWYGMGERRPRPLTIVRESYKLRIVFPKNPAHAVLTVDDIPENRQRFAALMQPETENHEENEHAQ